MRAIAPICLVASLISGTAAHAAKANNRIPDFQESMFQQCTVGTNIGDVAKVSNPILLLGSLLYFSEFKDLTGAVKDRLLREPLALPIVSSDAGNPDQVTCAINFETTVTGTVNMLGINIAAERGDVYRGSVRLVARQSIATVPEGGVTRQAWRSEKYKDLFRSTIGFIPPSTNDFFLIDNISIYIIQVDRYKTTNGGINAGVGLFEGGAKYKRDEGFSGSKVIVTGDFIPLKRDNFAVQIATTTPTTPPPPPEPSPVTSVSTNPQAVESIAPASDIARAVNSAAKVGI